MYLPLPHCVHSWPVHPKPAGHVSTQSIWLEEPSKYDLVPLGQRTHSDDNQEPRDSEYVPTGHFKQVVEWSVSLYVPSGQSWHCFVVTMFLNLPAGQDVQLPRSVASMPISQRQSSLLSLLFWDVMWSGHIKQSEDWFPGTGRYVLNGQPAQVEEPETANCPGRQDLQVDIDISATLCEYFPGLHSVQLLLSRAP